jgi:type II secretory pathway pseudopilin PulG
MHRPGSGQRGFTYLTVLFVVAFMGVGLAVTGEVWRTTVLRAREAELLWVGNQYRLAIERYYKRGALQYPRALDDLLKDPRDPGTQRYLRRRYADPVTRSEEWGLVKGPDGGIMGVYSRSGDKPFKSAGFAIANTGFEQAAAYSDWKFVYQPGVPGATQPVPPPANADLPDAARPILDATQAMRASMPPEPAQPPPSPSSVSGAPPPREVNSPLNLRHE